MAGRAEVGGLNKALRLYQRLLEGEDPLSDKVELKGRPVLQTLEEVCIGYLVRQPLDLNSHQVEPPDIGAKSFSVSLPDGAQVENCFLGRDVHREVRGIQEGKHPEAVNASG